MKGRTTLFNKYVIGLAMAYAALLSGCGLFGPDGGKVVHTITISKQGGKPVANPERQNAATGDTILFNAAGGNPHFCVSFKGKSPFAEKEYCTETGTIQEVVTADPKKETEYKYDLTIYNNDGTSETVDPWIIIK